MRRLGASVVPRRNTATALAVTTPTTTALTQHRNLEFLATYWAASWAMLWQWNFITMFPLIAMDMLKPSAVVSKTPLLHFFYEKRQEQKLQKALDSTVTEWHEELDTSSIDDAIARTF